ncbi:MAG: Uma2 family endonuclease [Planctomycetaceae bacterium]|nr:Uma2 family endonuclease [Planctomycetaceae bacterium]
MITLEIQRYAVEEYLERERHSDVRHEFLGGEIRAMTGGSSNHSLISVNVVADLRSQLKSCGCRVYNNDMRIKCRTGLYTYPDASVVCGPPEFENDRNDTLLNPVAIFEVLSPSTQAYDRGDKFSHYRTIPSLKEYVLISQDWPLVEHHIRDDSGKWTLFTTTDRAGSVQLAATRVELPMPEIYYGIEFAADPHDHGTNGAHKS